MKYRNMYFLFVALNVCVIGKELAVIQTSYGPIEGERFLSNWTNETIYSYKGIPYAAPPVGDRRFKDPVPPEPWSQIRDCTKEQPICPQAGVSGDGAPQMSEDCLYLNVYTPQLLSSGAKRLPVIVWIHGGMFKKGSGNYDDNGPDLMVAQQVIFVTLNYRLGALGFLSLGVEEAPGNAGLKDQTLALLWVKNEIHRFGGDPRKVTLFGQSAGAIAVHLHYLSPLSKGLFHRAIGDSGSPLAYRVRAAADGRRFALQLAKQLGCDIEDTTELLACLRAKIHQDIVKVQDLIHGSYQDDRVGLPVFHPTIDKDSGTKSFLPDYPFNLMNQKADFFVPFLMGVNNKEGIIQIFRSGEEDVRNITNNLEYLYALQVPEDTICSPKLKAEKLKHFYFRNASPSKLPANEYVDLYTDVLYAYGSTVNVKNYQNKTKVFLYYFTFSGKFKNEDVEQFQMKYNISGVTHAEELNYLFVKKGINQNIEEESNESITWRRMVKMWTNFAKHGKPTVGPDPLLQNVQWLPARMGRTNHLHININLRMSWKDLLASRTALWDNITFKHCS